MHHITVRQRLELRVVGLERLRVPSSGPRSTLPSQGQKFLRPVDPTWPDHTGLNEVPPHATTGWQCLTNRLTTMAKPTQTEPDVHARSINA